MWLFYPPSKPPPFHKHVRNDDGTWTLQESHPRKQPGGDHRVPLSTRNSGDVVINTYPLSPSQLGKHHSTTDAEVDETNALAFWETHYLQCLIIRNARADTTDPVTRQRLTEELTIGERKLAHWERHKNWNVTEAARIAERLKMENTSSGCHAAALTIPNRYRPERVVDNDVEIDIDHFIATRGVTLVAEKVKAPKRKPTKRSKRKFGR